MSNQPEEIKVAEEPKVDEPKVEETKEIKIADETIVFPLNASEMLYQELQKIMGDGKLTRSNIVIILLSLMQSVESYDSVHGVQKKAIILDVFNRLIDTQVTDHQEAMQLKLLVQLTIPTVIDKFKSIDNKETIIHINKKISSCCVLQ
jgi:hypothetical protein